MYEYNKVPQTGNDFLRYKHPILMSQSERFGNGRDEYNLGAKEAGMRYNTILDAGGGKNKAEALSALLAYNSTLLRNNAGDSFCRGAQSVLSEKIRDY